MSTSKSIKHAAHAAPATVKSTPAAAKKRPAPATATRPTLSRMARKIAVVPFPAPVREPLETAEAAATLSHRVHPPATVIAGGKASLFGASVPDAVISVKADVGFGNRVFLRGEGPGLNWEEGVPAECVANDLWQFVLKGAASPVKFKLLVNDSTWSIGGDYEVEPGQTVTVTPVF